jgi:UDP-glucose 4-epimerase
VRDVLAAIQRVTGRTVTVTEGPPRPGDPPALTTNIQRITRYCGWTPKILDLDVIIATAWAWEAHRVATRR